MQEIETDCYIGDDGLAYTNNRKYLFRTCEHPISGFYVHPKTGLIREQPYAVIRRRYRKSSEPLQETPAHPVRRLGAVYSPHTLR